MKRLGLALGLAVAAVLAVAGTALGHPLGNYTVNRAVAVTLTAEAAAVHYTIDMAEIPAFATQQTMDANGDATLSASERRAWAQATCEAARAALVATLDGRTLILSAAGDPALTFPAGAGGLDTLRLECPFAAAWTLSAGEHEVTIADQTEDGHVGWREVTMATGTWTILSSDVPAISPSAELTAYPTATVASPPDVRSARATFRADGGSGPATSVAATAGGPRVTSNDPFAALITGELTLPVAMLALLLAAGLGAVHALSPGHGKTLVAAYLIGSKGTFRQAVGLGATVAVTHTLGVFGLGAATLVAGELFIPERVIGWLSVASGGLVALLGIGLVWRALHAPADRTSSHAHDHPHPHPHSYAHDETPPTVSKRGLLALGLAGGMVPSASALIVLLAAVSTGRLLFGMGLIVAFGAGMAAVLAGLAAVTTLARGALVDRRGIAPSRWMRRVAGLLPVSSGIAVLAIGMVVTIAALGRVG
jgi:nickel/cobalt exporter